MKLVIISDLHDNLVNLKKCLDWCATAGTAAMLFAGDLTNEKTLDYLAKNFSGKIYLVRGNVDNYDENLLKNYSQIINLTRSGGAIEIGGRNIGLCHEPYLISDLLEQKTEIIFYGHTHKPWSSYAPYNAASLKKQKASEDKIEERDEVKLVNSGTLGGMFQKATFAVYDTASNELGLKILDELK